MTPDTGYDPATLSLVFAMGATYWYEGLLRMRFPDLNIEPLIAGAWEQPTNQEFIFTLTPNVKWHNKSPVNGRAFTAEDAAFGLNRIKEGTKASEGPRITAGSILEAVDKVEAVTTNQIKVTTKRPDASALIKLASPNLAFLAPEVFEAFEKFSSADTAIGTGAFILESAETDIGAELIRNPDYYDPAKPNLDEVHGVTIADDQARWAAFLAGQLDIEIVPGNEAKDFAARPANNAQTQWDKSTGLIWFQPNTLMNPFDDARVTKAMRLLVDHEEFKSAWNEVWFGGGQLVSALPDTLDQWDLKQEEFSNYLEWKQEKNEAVTEALRLLDAAGFNRSNPLKFVLQSQDATGQDGSAAAELLNDQWKRLSNGVVDTELFFYASSSTVQAARREKTFTYLVSRQGTSVVDVDAWLSEVYHSEGLRNECSYSDAQVDSMVEQQQQMFDEGQRKALVKQIVQRLADSHPATTPYGRSQLHAIHQNLRGYTATQYVDGYQYGEIWRDA
jgi:ABC-type transport system substrate-binding protein